MNPDDGFIRNEAGMVTGGPWPKRAGNDAVDMDLQHCCGHLVATDRHRWVCPTCDARWVWDDDAAKFFRAFPIESRSDDLDPDPRDLVRELRQALGLFDGAMTCSPKTAWDEAITVARRLAGTRPIDNEHSDGGEA